MILLAAIVAGLGAVGITTVLRALPPFAGWNERGVKPWSCDLCMSFWCALLCLGVGMVFGQISAAEAFMAWMPAFTIAFWTVQRIHPEPMGGPPIDPPSPPTGPE